MGVAGEFLLKARMTHIRAMCIEYCKENVHTHFKKEMLLISK